MEDENLGRLVEKYLRGTATAEERETVLSWYRHVDHGRIEIPLDHAGEKQQISERMLYRLEQHIGKDTPVRKITWYRWVAAAVVLCLLGGGWYHFSGRSVTESLPRSRVSNINFKNDVLPGGNKATLTLANGTRISLDSIHNGRLASQLGSTVLKMAGGIIAYKAEKGTAPSPGSVSFNTLSTPRGGEYQLVLPDGSMVWLNAASSIRYPTAFTGHERKVSITGEAYFEVAPDPGKPFRVEAGTLELEVLGTHFDINAYKDDKSIRTTLLEGAVRVNAKLLRPGQQARLTADGSVTISNAADTANVTAWKKGYFHFDRTSIESIMRQVERWYDIEVVYQGRITTDQFQGDIPRTATLTQLLTILEYSRVHFKLDKRTLTVLP